MPRLDEDYANELSSAPKVINEDIIWRAEGIRHKLKARVLAPHLKEVLELRGNIGLTNYSFSLLYQQLTVRRFDNSPRHTTPDGEIITVPHKHTWNEVHGDSPAYIPLDIDVEADLNAQFLQFLAEENISLNGNYQYVMFGP